MGCYHSPEFPSKGKEGRFACFVARIRRGVQIGVDVEHRDGEDGAWAVASRVCATFLPGMHAAVVGPLRKTWRYVVTWSEVNGLAFRLEPPQWPRSALVP